MLCVNYFTKLTAYEKFFGLLHLFTGSEKCMQMLQVFALITLTSLFWPVNNFGKWSYKSRYQ